MTFYKINSQGMGAFLCPPGHPDHTHSLEGYESSRHRTAISSRRLSAALADGFDGQPEIRGQVQQIFDRADVRCDELWLRTVYAHFRNCYTPESGSRSASDVIAHNVARMAQAQAQAQLDTLGAQLRERARVRAAVAEAGGSTPAGENPENFRQGVTALYGKRRGWEITAAPDATRVYVYALADDGSRYSADHLAQYAEALDASDEFTSVTVSAHPEDSTLDRVVAVLADPPQPMDPERHSAVACIREYFPDHTPRLDLIGNPKPTCGPCEKCGQKVQYEGKLGKLAAVRTRVDGRGVTHWSYSTECSSDGGDHTR